MSKIKALINPVTPFQQNAPIVFCEETKKCAFVDPGGDLELLLASASKNNLLPEKILLTHGHIDHAAGATELANILNLEIIGPHIDDKFLLDELEAQGSMLGIPAQNCSPDLWLEDGESVSVGNALLDVFFTPGHSPGHIIFFHKPSNFAIVGDVLFAGSIGRTDLPGGNYEQLIESIKTKLWPLGKNVTFVPGHGPISNFMAERDSNPFVSDNSFK